MSIFHLINRSVIGFFLISCGAMATEVWQKSASKELVLSESIMYLGFHAQAGAHTFQDTHKHHFEPPQAVVAVTQATTAVTQAQSDEDSKLSHTENVEIPIYIMNKEKTLVGTITAKDTIYGLMLRPKLTGLVPEITPGIHGFHIHEIGSCEKMGMDAGGHLDPMATKAHLGPFNPQGHLGDLPAVYVDKDGTLSLPVVAPKLKVKDILGRSIMIHGGGDNYSDAPEPLGGGGSRMLCGVIPAHPGY